MTATLIEAARQSSLPVTVFNRVLVGIDGSAEALEAARQAARLHDPNTELMLLSAWTLPPPLVSAGMTIPWEADARVAQQRALEAAARAQLDIVQLAVANVTVERGFGWDALIRAARRGGYTLIAVGSHGAGRTVGVLSGSTATELVHKSPCSVLVARASGTAFPRKIVVGVDGSPESKLAYAAAHELAVRFGSTLWPVVATGGKGVNRAAADAIIDVRYEELPDRPVRALVAAAADADLAVVGSRGLHGLASLGSVSERVAHRAYCSTLVVRNPQQ
jgi:nucleotide-binding universal stress UspA family protein